MHHIYTTKAIIVKSASVGEANRYYFLLTEDLGFIKAAAQGVRLDKSKLKGHLQDFCFVSVSLVKGKNIWRITSVETLMPVNFISNINKITTVKNIFALLLRLLHGEEKNDYLFRSVESFYTFLLNNNLSVDNIKNLETITVLRILYHLGYFKNTKEIIVFLETADLSFDLLDLFNNKRQKAILDINTALNATNL